MLIPDVPPPTQAGEITVQNINRQTFEQDLTRSNWRYFCQIPEQSPLPGTGRRDDGQTTPTR